MNQTLWRRMNPVQKAGAILHEAFMEVMLERNADLDHSDPVRTLDAHANIDTNGVGDGERSTTKRVEP